MATYLDPEHRKWLSNSELGEVEKELIKAFPLPQRSSLRITPIYQLEDDEIDDQNNVEFTPDKFAQKLS